MRNPSAEVVYLFRHALLRDAAYQLQMPDVRARLHALVVEVLEAALAPAEIDGAAAELADHAHQAGEALGGKEVTFRLRAIEFELSRLHYAEVARQSERVAAHPQADASARARALLRLGDSLRQRGLAREALGVYARALEAAGSSQESMRGNVLRAIADTRYRLGSYAEAETVYRESIAILQRSGQRASAATAIGNFGLLLASTGRRNEAEAAFRSAIGEFEALGVRREGTTPLVNLANLMLERGDAGEALRLTDRADAVFRAHSGGRDPIILGTRSLALNALGRKEESLRCLLEALEVARGNGQRAVEGTCLSNLGSQLAEDGKVSEGRRALEESTRVLREIGAPRSLAIALAGLATACRDLGDLDDALRQWDEAIGILRQLGAADFLGRELCSRAYGLLTVGKLEMAEADLEEAARLLPFPAFASWLARYHYPVQVRLLAARGDAAAFAALEPVMAARVDEGNRTPALTQACETARRHFSSPAGARPALVFGFRLEELPPELRRALPEWWGRRDPGVLTGLAKSHPGVLQEMRG